MFPLLLGLGYSRFFFLRKNQELKFGSKQSCSFGFDIPNQWKPFSWESAILENLQFIKPELNILRTKVTYPFDRREIAVVIFIVFIMYAVHMLNKLLRMNPTIWVCTSWSGTQVRRTRERELLQRNLFCCNYPFHCDFSSLDWLCVSPICGNNILKGRFCVRWILLKDIYILSFWEAKVNMNFSNSENTQTNSKSKWEIFRNNSFHHITSIRPTLFPSG